MNLKEEVLGVINIGYGNFVNGEMMEAQVVW